MNDKTQSFTFYSKRVAQRDFILYLSAIKGRDLGRLCEGLRTPESRGTPSERIEGAKDAQAFVDSITASAEFADEITRIESEAYIEDSPYQRIIEEARVKSIAAYLREESAVVPNGVVLAVDENVICKVRDKKHFASVQIEWESELPLNIIDGQHRVEGLKMLIQDGFSEFEDFELPVCVLVDLPFYMQAEIFAIINGRQTKVPRSRIYDLLGYRPIQDPVLREKAYRGEMAINRFCHQAVRVLNTSKKSPWLNRIKMRGSGAGIVTQGAMVDHIAQLVMPRRESSRATKFPVLYKFFKEGDLIGLSKTLIIYFMGIASAWPDQWKKDSSLKASLFGKTNGVAVMTWILQDLILLAGGPENLKFETVRDFWKEAPLDRIENPPPGGSGAYQMLWYRAIMEKAAGPDYVDKIAIATNDYRKTLREIGALY